MDVKTLTKPQILAFSDAEPERLFETAEAMADRFKALAQKWHPDVPTTGDGTVFAHINILHDAAKLKIKAGEWHTPGLLQLTGTDGAVRKIRYIKDFDCGLGRGYIGKSYVTYVISDDYADLFHNATKQLENFKFPNDKEREQVGICLPLQKTAFAAGKDQLVLVVSKPADSVRLRDLLDHVGGKIPPVHVAWIINRLLMLANFLAYNKITHSDISLDSVFVSPERHSVALIGGWWYTMPSGVRMARVQPARTLVYAPHSILTTKIANIRIDLELIRLIGREILGDESGTKLGADKTIPVAMIEWLRSASTGDAIADYERWPEVLQTCFGIRRFVKWDINLNDIYEETP